MPRLTVVHITPELLLGLTPTVLNTYSGQLWVTLNAHAKNVATRLYILLESCLFMRKIPARREDMGEGECWIISALLVDLLAVHLAL